MYRPFKSVSIGSMFSFFLLAPLLISGTRPEKTPAPPSAVISPLPEPSHLVELHSAKSLILDEGKTLYDSLQLRKRGLGLAAFEAAWLGYRHMLEQGWLHNKNVLSICDFSQSSRRKRLYVIDVAQRRLVINTYVAHGRNSGGEYAQSFSNQPESHKSSLGFFVTRHTYFGDHGLSLRLHGLEKGINDRADARQIVVHGSDYVGQGYLRSNRYSGRSFGCPAVPEKISRRLIETIKDGSCLFIYHPSKYYLTRSKILNG